MKKTRCPKNTTVLLLCYVVVILSAQVSMALSLRLSKILQKNDEQKVEKEDEQAQDWLDASDERAREIPKRICDGFPCMYSHLGTKAGRASLYKTLAGFIDDCLNDASCDPGRRKRSWIQAMNIRKAQDQVIDSTLDRRLKNVKLSRTIVKDSGTNVSLK